MAMSIREVSQQWPAAKHCDALYEVRDEAVGLHAFIALHDHKRGPGYGGIRRRAYRRVADAVCEVVALAEQMTLKTAFAGLPAGGAKAVILDPGGLERAPLYEAFGRAVEELGGAYFAGPDVGTSEDELLSLRQTSRYVSTAGARPSASAARGVVDACREALAFEGIAPTLDASSGGLDALVVGVGTVGRLVASGLRSLGLRLAVSDLDASREVEVAASLGCDRVATDLALSTPASLLVPCGVNPLVSATTLERFAVRVICGAANHQLAEDHFAHALAERNILYVPDFAANAGAVIEGVIRQSAPVGADVDAEVERALSEVGPRVRRLLEEARTLNMTPLELALASVELEPLSRPCP